MRKTILTLLLVFTVSFAFTQQLTSEEILNKSIQYHDPSNEWNEFSYRLFFKQESPKRGESTVEVELKNAMSYFSVYRSRDSVKAGISIDSCFNHMPKKVDCERIKFFRNYYTYLWGLPMKLKDPGTNLDKEVGHRMFDGRHCYVLKVPYEKDVWYFFIDEENFALHGYEFFHDEEKGVGEKIFLSDEIQVGDMKIPNGRKWYKLHDDQAYLGKDILEKFEELK